MRKTPAVAMAALTTALVNQLSSGDPTGFATLRELLFGG